MNAEKSQPLSKKQVGRFQVSIWKRHKIVPGDEAGFRPEREYDVIRACVQYSRFNRLTREFDRQQIWCNPDDLRNLVQALDELGQANGGEVK
jgi:ASC-1-like (ASCH) protein